jgi:hypothetical protein
VIGTRLTAAAQMQYGHVDARDTARARIVIVPVLTPGVLAMTLGRWILVRRGHDGNVALIGHELVHVEQWRRYGVIRFLTGYLGAYTRARRAGVDHWTAYRAIPFEAEARLRSGA